MSVASNLQPPSSVPGAAAPRYRVGQDRDGHWLAIADGGRAGGLFRTRKDAVRYACIEAGCRPDDVRVEEAPLRLRLT